MALMLEDLKDNKLYRKQLFLPINAVNKKKGSLIYLLSPNIEETARIMASSYFENPNLFNAYYLEKDINLIITENTIYNEERNPYDPSITLSKYTRYTITDSDEMEERTGKKLYGGTGILFLEPYTNSYVGYIIINGSTLVNAHSISVELDKELMGFAVDILKCNICHKDIPNKYKKILKSEYGFKFVGSSSTGVAQNDITLEGEGSLEIGIPALLTEGMTRINMELAIWKAQLKITEMILKNWDNTNWMRTQYKSMKAKLNKIPLPGFTEKIDDSIESLKDHYENQKETIKFMTEMAAFELRDEYDLEDITKEYTKWVRSTRSSKAFKLKLIREVKDSYKETIKLYKNNLKRYEAQSTVEKRVENGMALISKTFSIFSFLSGGPLGVLKDVVMKAILPKSQKKNVLSVAEVEAKIEAYEKIVNELEELEDEIQKESTNESTLLEGRYSRPYNRSEIEKNYGKNTLDRLMKDPAHRFRADTGIELIHQEPTLDELNRIMRNWELMSDDDKMTSDKKSLELYGKTNKDHYKELFDLYEYTAMVGMNPVMGIGGGPITRNITSKGRVFSGEDDEEESLQEGTRNVDNIYYVSRDNDLDEAVIECTEDAIGFYYGLINAIGRYPHKVNKLYVYKPDGDYKVAKFKNGKLNLGGKVALKLRGVISVSYDKDGSISYEWDYALDDNTGKAIYDWQESTLLETPLTAEQRKNLKDSDYGLPAKRAYPMPDKAHVKAAIRMFNHVDKQDEKVLASAITRKIKEFDMEDEVTVSKKNRYYEYCLSSIREGVELKPLREDVEYTDISIRDNDTITFFESALAEDASYNKALRRILFSERLRNQKDVALHYDAIKSACPFIKQTYYDISKYRQFNLFVDMTYYIESFIKNNYLKLDKSINTFFELINRFLKDERFKNAGYNKRTVFVPITGWKVEDKTDIWDYRYNTNPISIIYRLIFSGGTERLKEAWGGINFVFIGKNGYFKIDPANMDKKFLPLFRTNIDKLVSNSFIDDSDEPDSSVRGIVTDIISRIESPDDVTNTGIKVNNLLGDDEDLSPEEFAERIDASDVSSEDEDDSKGMDAEQETIRMEREKELVKRVKEVAEKSADADDANVKLNNDEEFKQILQDLKMSSPNQVDYSVTRVSRINTLKNDFTKKKIDGDKNKTIGDIVLGDNYFSQSIPETSLPIDTVNEEWKHLKGANFADAYNIDSDIYRVLYHFSDCKVPVAIRDYKVENTSNSEDTVNTWTVACEDINGKRFTLKFDVPIIINKRFMKLRGNEKIMGTQLMNLPIIKTDLHTVQITTNYNKVFISPYGSTSGKSFVTSDRIIKALGKYKGKNITYVVGDNSRVCRRYELPIDYIDMASSYMSIKCINKTTGTYEFLFNQEIIEQTYPKLLDKNKLLIGIHTDLKGKQNPIYADNTLPVSSQIASMLCGLDEEFNDTYRATSVSNRYMFSMASIMSTTIPVAVLIGYAIGLIPMLDRAGIKYTVEDKRPRYDKSSQDILVLKDAYILYDLTYDSSLLLNGLKGCDLAAYSLKEVNGSSMWLDFLDNYGGRIKSDGLDMFYDLLFDPITKNVCLQYELPNNYVDGLLYANSLLCDNKYNKHTDIRGNRYRNNEIIAAYVYKALCNSYSMYRRSLKAGRDATMSIKQSAVIDLILQDNTESDYSSLSPLLEFESANAVSFKGLSGMNSDRAYGLDKRSFDKSMVNILAMSTGFGPNSGVNRQATIDPNIDTSRGYIKGNPDDLSITKTFCMTEALTPYGATSDDPFRTAMTFVQTSKHGMRTAVSDPSMISTGAEEALVYLTSDTFSHKAKGKGKIKEKTEDYLVIEYDQPIGYDGRKTEVVDLREKMVKNSDGGFYQSLKLNSDYKVGDIVRENDVVALDNLSYKNTVGPKDNYAYNIGTFCKFAIVMSDEGFEDSCRSTEWLAKAMSSLVVIEQEYNFDKDTNIYYIVKKGQQIQEGEPILIFQNAFEDEDANALIRALKTDDEDIVQELGRVTLKSKVTGVVKDIKVRRCVDIDECSPTMQKVIKDYEKSIKDVNKVLDKYDPDKAKTADPTYKLPATGKLKNSEDSVLITIYVAYQDDFGVSDKTVCYSALKGVSSKEIIPGGKEAFSTYRPDEKIHYIQSEIGDMKRMVGSVYKVGALNKVLVETHRHMCDIMGIKWKYYDEWPMDNN